MQTYQALQEAGRAEQTARLDGATRVFTVQAKPKGASAAGAGQAQDTGAALQAQLQTFMQAPSLSPQESAAGRRLAGMSLMAQYQLGIDPAARGVVPQATAEWLVASVNNAPPESKGKAMGELAAKIAALPRALTMPNGTLVAPQAMLLQQLRKAHLTPIDAALRQVGGQLKFLGLVAAVLQKVGPIETLELVEWDRVFNINIRANVMLIKHFAPVMRAAGGG